MGVGGRVFAAAGSALPFLYPFRQLCLQVCVCVKQRSHFANEADKEVNLLIITLEPQPDFRAVKACQLVQINQFNCFGPQLGRAPHHPTSVADNTILFFDTYNCNLS